MSKRKYESYEAVDDFSTEVEFNYRDALSAYSKMDAPKTLFGITEQGDMEVIFSKQ